MSKTIIANWKMNLSLNKSLILLEKILPALENNKNKIVICPDFASLGLSAIAVSGSKLFIGAQDCADSLEGSFTGEVSARVLREIGASYVILGHSERRIFQLENDALINKKIKTALGAGLKVILCLGENIKEKKAKLTKKVLQVQLKNALKGVDKKESRNILIAYEPVWAIGSGKALEAQEAGEIAEFLKSKSLDLIGRRLEILYGGSVSLNNASLFLKNKNISGLLLGGASLEAEKFISICSI